jgi:hypothetical protein
MKLQPAMLNRTSLFIAFSIPAVAAIFYLIRLATTTILKLIISGRLLLKTEEL